MRLKELYKNLTELKKLYEEAELAKRTLHSFEESLENNPGFKSYAISIHEVKGNLSDIQRRITELEEIQINDLPKEELVTTDDSLYIKSLWELGR